MKTTKILLMIATLAILSSCGISKNSNYGGTDVTIPCTKEAHASPFKGSGIDEDYTPQGAREDAFTNAQIDLAYKQEVLIEGAVRRFKDKVRSGSELVDSRSEMERDIFIYVKQYIQGASIICEEYRNNETTKILTCFIAISINPEAFQKQLYEMEVLKTKFERDKFKESYQEELNNYKPLNNPNIK